MAYSCARASHDCNESFLGTASPFRYALMIEYHGDFPESAIIGSNLPAAVKKHVLKLYETKSDIRILLMKKQLYGASKKLFWADCAPNEMKLWHYSFDKYEDLLQLKLGEMNKQWQLVTEPQFFICTNGAHDPCCGKYGQDLFAASELQYNNVWQTTHLGGDRFAATVLALPTGIYYRRVHPAALAEIIAAHWRREVYLPCFGGRSVYARAAQIAEYMLREKTHVKDLQRFTLITQSSVKNRHTVQFADQAKKYTLVLQEVIEERTALLSCHAKTPSPLMHYELLDFVVEPFNVN